MNIELLSKMVKELLLDNDAVTLPGLGSFVAEMVPAVFSDNGYTINPPYRKLYFRENMEQEDDLLADFYASSNNVSKDVALRVITDFMGELKELLNSRKNILFPELGRLRATKENNYFFVPFENIDIYPEGVGLEPVSLKAHPAYVNTEVSTAESQDAPAPETEVLDTPAASESAALSAGGGASPSMTEWDLIELAEPAEETPTEEVPAEETPVEEIPAEETPAEEAPAEESPVEETPVDEVPVEETPTEETSAEEVPVEEVPAEEVPAEEIPAEEVPAEETPAEEASAEETPIDETPIEEIPVEETSVEEVPVEETPAEEVPVEETPAEETPVEEVPAEEKHRLSRGWRITLLVIGIIVCVAVILLLVFLILSRVAPGFTDSLLYTKEELQIINYPLP